jgi:endonuclease/exonuclease/phosphatase family metal-dependent hydrolase
VTVATFNAEWLGHPSRSGNWSGSRSSQIQQAATEILTLDPDIVALQEVIVDPLNGNALADLVTELNLQDPLGAWDGEYNPKFSFWWNPDYEEFPAQRQAYVWKSATVSFISSAVMLEWIGSGDNRFASGRLPFLLTVEAGPVAARRQLQLINLHLKCCTNNDDRRLASMTALVDELRANYADSSLIVLGDFNVADSGGAYGEISDWGFYQDDDADGIPDFTHAAGAEADLSWDDIDHVMISNELVSAWEIMPVGQRNGTLASSMSDHDIVFARLGFQPPSLAEQYDSWIQSYVAIEPALAATSGFGEDFDNDKLANGLEFMTGTSPMDMSPSVLGIGRNPDGSLQLSYRQRKGLPASSLDIFAGDSLQAATVWTRLAPAVEDLTVTDDTDPDFEQILIRVPAPDPQQRGFFRLEGSLEP